MPKKGLFRKVRWSAGGSAARLRDGLGSGRRGCHIGRMKLFVSHRPRSGARAGERAGDPPQPAAPVSKDKLKAAQPAAKVPELGGPSGPEPTRYGDWERKGICSDF